MAIPMDSELRAILLDVAEKSPTGGMFAGLAPKSIHGAFALPDSPVSVAQAGLSSAERHLITVYRGELSWVLREAFLVNHFARPSSEHKTAQDGADLNRDSIAALASRHASFTPPEVYRHRTWHFLAKLSTGSPISNRDELASMLVASMRLSDAPSARHFYGINSLAQEDYAGAKSAIAPLLDQANPTASSYAFGMWRQILDEQGFHERSMRAGSRAIQLASRSGQEEVFSNESSILLLAHAQNGISQLGDDFWPRNCPLDATFHETCKLIDNKVSFGSLSRSDGTKFMDAVATLCGRTL